jgi:crotonobetainyl-CoA:carnitine CoA-transferase CaiB-like acyl-CoA transferase
MAPPPLLGEHTGDVLRELGRDEGAIEALRAAGAIR